MTIGVSKKMWKIHYHSPEHEWKNMAICQVEGCGKVLANNGFAKSSHAKMHERRSEVFRDAGGSYVIFTGEDPSLEAQGAVTVKVQDNGTFVDRSSGKQLYWNGWSWSKQPPNPAFV